MGFWAVASSALDWYEGRRQQRLERRRIGQQQAFNREMYEKRYQMTMADMRKAGLNPILAYKQGAGSAPTSGGGNIQAVKPGLADAMSKTAQANLAKAQVGQVDANTALLHSNSAKALAERELIRSKTAFQNMENAFSAKDWMLLPQNVSRLAFKHTVWNQAGTEFYNKMKEVWFNNKGKLGNSFDPNSPLYKLPRNQKRKIEQDRIYKQINSGNLSFDQWWNKVQQLRTKFFGKWKTPDNYQTYRNYSPHSHRK